MVGNDETLTGTPEQEYALAADFEKQRWHVWSEGFRYAYEDHADVDHAIRVANKCQKAFVKTFSEGE